MACVAPQALRGGTNVVVLDGYTEIVHSRVPIALARLFGVYSLLTRQPNSSGPSWSPGMFSTRKRMSGEKLLRLRWTS
jgi:hypothetical protein